ncbi:MAG: hypothetical protein R3B13_32510 [Polyangiaceae bacterium]
MSLRYLSSFALVFSLAACGGAPPPDAAPADTSGAAGAPSAEPKEEGPSLEEMETHFKKGCNSKLADSEEYCACSWEQMKASFTLEEMRGKNEDPARMAEFKQAVVKACADKMPEAGLKSGFMRACGEQGPEVEPYCECMWTGLTAKLSKAELADESTLKSEKFHNARKTSVKECSPKLPEKVAKAGFMKGCSRTDAHAPFCECAWKTIRKDSSPAEIQSGMLDLKEMQTKIKTACEKLRPKKTEGG